MINIRLFGPFSLEQDGNAAALPPSSQARCLLAYLALFREQKHPRSLLAGTFWPDQQEERARRALSQALWYIRRLFPELITAEGETIGMAAPDVAWVDVHAFELAVHPWLENFPLAPEGKDELIRAIELYRGDLLEGTYEDWALLERERLRILAQQTLEQLLLTEKSSGNFNQALEYGIRLLQFDPLREATHREVMRLHHLLGHPEAALRQFETCQRILQAELDLEPEPETLALVTEIARREKTEFTPYLPENLPAMTAPILEGEHSLSIPLVGRRTERAQLLLHVEAALDRRGGIVLLEGEAGIGKTRLLQEMVRDAEWRGAQVLWGSGQESGSSPFGSLFNALNNGLSALRIRQISQLVEPLWLKILKPHLAVLSSQTVDLQDSPSLPENIEQSRFVEAMVSFLAGWVRTTPLVLILDDLHWMDTDTLGILPNLASRLSESGILCITAYRRDEAYAMPAVWESLQALDRAGPLMRLILQRLDTSLTGELIRASLGLNQPAPLFEARLFRETDGNPLFVLETLRALQDEGLLIQKPEGNWITPWDETTADYAELSIPPLVERVIARRLANLTEPARHLLYAAAILGSHPDYEILKIISGLEMLTFLDACRELIQHHFLDETEVGYGFNHDKILQVAYQEIEPQTKKLLHKAAGETMESIFPARIDELARHFTCAGEYEKSVQYSLLAAKRAAAIYANFQASALYTQAWLALSRCPESASPACQIEILTARAGIYDRLGKREAQRTDLEALDDILTDTSQRIDQKLRWARFYETVSDYPNMIQAAQAAIEFASSLDDSPRIAAGQIMMGKALNMQADSQGARAVLEMALEKTRAAGDSQQEAACSFAMARVYFDYQNRYAEALEYCQRALDIFKENNDQTSEAETLQLMGAILSDLGNTESSLDCKLKVLEIRRKIGDRRGEAMALYSLAIYCRYQGDNVTSLEYSRASVVIAHSIGELRTEAYGRTYVGINLEESDPQQALCEYQRALEIRRTIGQHAMAVDTLAGLARACLRLGQASNAKKHIQEALAWVDEHGAFGVGDIGLVYLAAHDTFMATGEQEHAAQIIRTAYADLTSRAATLTDDDIRQQFLLGLPQHRRVLELYQKHNSISIVVHLPLAGNNGQTTAVTWTLEAPEDRLVTNKVALRHLRLKRLLMEASEQNAVPTHLHLAEALGVGLRTIERDMTDIH